MNDDEGSNRAAWESSYSNAFKYLFEDHDGPIAVPKGKDLARKIEKGTAKSTAVRRHVLIAFDASEAASNPDLAPSRYTHVLHILTRFAGRFFDRNPMSHLGLILCKDSMALPVIPLTTSRIDFEDGISRLIGRRPSGFFSVLNAIKTAEQVLKATVAGGGLRELHFINFSLGTRDAMDVAQCVANKALGSDIRISAISFSGDIHSLHICCTATGGSFRVPLYDSQLSDWILSISEPLPKPDGLKSKPTLTQHDCIHGSEQVPNMRSDACAVSALVPLSIECARIHFNGAYDSMRTGHKMQHMQKLIKGRDAM